MNCTFETSDVGISNFLRGYVFTALIAALLTVAMTASVPATAQETVERTTIVVPFPAGGRTDIGTRILAQSMSEEMGIDVSVENRPGAGGVVGARYVAGSEPDGETLLMTSAALLVSGYTMDNANTLDDFTVIAVLDDSQPVLSVNASSPFQSAQDLIEKAKANPGSLTLGYTPGATVQIIAAGFVDAASIDVRFVPFKGDADAILALAGGSIDAYISGLSSAKSLLDAGKLKLLAVASENKLSEYPEIPRLVDAGVDFSASLFNALFAPADTPEGILVALEKGVGDGAQKPEVVARLKESGLNPIYLNREDSREFLSRQNELIGRITEMLDLQK